MSVDVEIAEEELALEPRRVAFSHSEESLVLSQRVSPLIRFGGRGVRGFPRESAPWGSYPSLEGSEGGGAVGVRRPQ